MGYLVLHDYNLFIQPSELKQIQTNDVFIMLNAESFAKGQMISHLTQRYDVEREFQETLPYNPDKVYNSWDLVEINFAAFDATKTYALKACVIQAGNGYICTTPITVAGAFNASEWALLGAQYDLFYVTTPEKEFNYQCYYKVGDKVFWKNKVYTAAQETRIPDHYSKIQSPSYSAIPYVNVFPDNVQNGGAAWGQGVTYTVAAGTLPTDETKWTKGDNRSAQCVEYMLKISIYKMCSRLAINNVPENREIGYEEALVWLKEVSKGIVNCDIPERQPDQGMPVMWGGQVKRVNQW